MFGGVCRPNKMIPKKPRDDPRMAGAGAPVNALGRELEQWLDFLLGGIETCVPEASWGPGPLPPWSNTSVPKVGKPSNRYSNMLLWKLKRPLVR